MILDTTYTTYNAEPRAPRKAVLAVVGAVLMITASPALAQDSQSSDAKARPPVIQKLFDCRTIADDSERLACYDREVSAVQQAEAQSEITIADKEIVAQTRRDLFGYTIPKGLFGEEDKKNDLKQVEMIIEAVSVSARGKYRLRMENGALWVQIDSTRLPRDPKPGDTALIKKAALGSYFVKINRGRAIRMRRVR